VHSAEFSPILYIILYAEEDVRVRNYLESVAGRQIVVVPKAVCDRPDCAPDNFVPRLTIEPAGLKEDAMLAVESEKLFVTYPVFLARHVAHHIS
jgi:hypothetical protein